jgi:hypothetical protein
MFPATFADSSDWGISESLRLSDKNFNSPNSIDILLADNVLFEVRRHVSNTRSWNYPILRGGII